MERQTPETPAPETVATVQSLTTELVTRIRNNALEGARLGARFNRLQATLRERFRENVAAGKGDADAVSTLLVLSVEAYSVISRHVVACMDDLISAGERRLGVAASTSSQLSDLPISELPRLNLSGKPGETVETAFVIRNDFKIPVSFNLRCQHLSSESSPGQKYQLKFIPESASLEPDTHSIVQLRAQFAADIAPATYLCQVTIDGLPDRHDGADSKQFCIELNVAA